MYATSIRTRGNISPVPLSPRGRLRLLVAAGLLACLFGAATPAARAQAIFPGVGGFGGGAPGILIDTNGHVTAREGDDTKELAAMRKRAREAADAAKDEKLAFVSLPKAFARAKAAIDAGQPIPEDVRYLGGITQLQYVLVYPEEQDLVIAGPAEPWVVDGVTASGKRSGRPVLQLDDLVVTMRTARKGGGQLFGCGIYPDEKSVKIAEEVARTMARATRKARMEALAKALGPQEVRVFGTAPDTRVALVCVAADYKLKRFGLGLDTATTVPIGSAVDNSRSAASMVWFEASYEPLLVSPDGNAFQIRGNRLAVGAGMFNFDPRGATEKAKAFTQKFTKHMPEMAVVVPLFADLQNVTDLSLLSNLIRVDGLDRKAGWDNAWVYDEQAYPVAKVPSPKTADTLVASTGGSLAAGGVVLTLGQKVAPGNRAKDEKGALDALKKEGAKSRQGEPAKPETKTVPPPAKP